MGSIKRAVALAAATLCLTVLLPATADAYRLVASQGKPGRLAGIQKVIGVHLDFCLPDTSCPAPALTFRAPVLKRSPATRKRQRVTASIVFLANGGRGWHPVRKFSRVKAVKPRQNRFRMGKPIDMYSYSADNGRTWNYLPGGLKWQVRMTFNWRTAAGRFLGKRVIHLRNRSDYLCAAGGQCVTGKWIWLG